MLKTRVYLAADRSSEYREWDSFSDQEQEEIRLQLQLQFIESMGAKNIKVKEK